MANRRMIARDVVGSDGFITLPFSAQALFLHLTIEADDEGFVGTSMRVLRLSGCSMEDLTALEGNGFIYRFKSGVILLRHWYISNQVQKDRRKTTTFQAERALVKLDANNAYVMLDTDCIQDGYSFDVQVNQGNQGNLTEIKKGNPVERRVEEAGKGTNSAPNLLSDADYAELTSRCGGCVEVDKWLSMYMRLGGKGPLEDVIHFINTKGTGR